MPSFATWCGRRPLVSTPPIFTAPARGGLRLQMAADGGRLAHAVAAHQGDGLTFLDRKIDAEQRLACTVECLDTGNVEQHQAWSPK